MRRTTEKRKSEQLSTGSIVQSFAFIVGVVARHLEYPSAVLFRLRKETFEPTKL